MAAAASSSSTMPAWECSRAGDRRGCRYVQFALERPQFCHLCGKCNTYERIERPTRVRRGAARLRAAPPSAAPGSTLAVADAVSGVVADDASESNLEVPDERVWRWGGEITPTAIDRAASSWEPWRRITCDLPRKYLTLFGGKRGTGKTRILLRVAGGIARTMRRPVLYGMSDGIPDETLRLWCSELGIEDALDAGGIAFVESQDLEDLVEAARELRPVAIFADALKRYRLGGAPARSETTAERQACELLKELAGELDAAVLAVLHMRSDQKDYSVGGNVQQLCDLILRGEKRFVGDPPSQTVRLWCDDKNRFGRDDRQAFLQHLDGGGLELHPYDEKGGKQ